MTELLKDLEKEKIKSEDVDRIKVNFNSKYIIISKNTF